MNSNSDASLVQEVIKETIIPSYINYAVLAVLIYDAGWSI